MQTTRRNQQMAIYNTNQLKCQVDRDLNWAPLMFTNTKHVVTPVYDVFGRNLSYVTSRTETRIK